MSNTPVALGLIILGMGVVTYAIRLSPMMLLGRVEGRPLMRRALRFVPPAVLSALIFPELLLPGGTLDLRGIRGCWLGPWRPSSSGAPRTRS
jgi:branched-subunit amino acid transport protein